MHSSLVLQFLFKCIVSCQLALNPKSQTLVPQPFKPYKPEKPYYRGLNN